MRCTSLSESRALGALLLSSPLSRNFRHLQLFFFQFLKRSYWEQLCTMLKLFTVSNIRSVPEYGFPALTSRGKWKQERELTRQIWGVIFMPVPIPGCKTYACVGGLFLIVSILPVQSWLYGAPLSSGCLLPCPTLPALPRTTTSPTALHCAPRAQEGAGRRWLHQSVSGLGAVIYEYA